MLHAGAASANVSERFQIIALLLSLETWGDNQVESDNVFSSLFR